MLLVFVELFCVRSRKSHVIYSFSDCLWVSQLWCPALNREKEEKREEKKWGEGTDKMTLLLFIVLASAAVRWVLVFITTKSWSFADVSHHLCQKLSTFFLIVCFYYSVHFSLFQVLEELDGLRKKPDAQAEEILSIEKLIAEAYSVIDKAVKVGTLHRNTGARRKSRLARRKKAVEIHHGWYTPAPAPEPAPALAATTWLYFSISLEGGYGKVLHREYCTLVTIAHLFWPFGWLIKRLIFLYAPCWIK